MIFLFSKVYDTDENSSIQKLVKGLKLITDLLPFDKKLEIIYNNQNLPKYLVLCSVIIENSVNLVIESLLEKFR